MTGPPANATPKAPFWLRLVRQPTSVEVGLLFLLAGITLAVASDATVPASWFFFLAGTQLFCILLFGLRAVLWTLSFKRLKRQRRSIPAWSVALAAPALMLVSTATDLDLMTRLWLCQNAIQRDAEWNLDLTPEQQNNLLQASSLETFGFYGLFTGTLFHIEPGRSVWYKTSTGSWLVGTGSIYGGIVYCRQGEPGRQFKTDQDHLFGPWWVWRCTD